MKNVKLSVILSLMTAAPVLCVASARSVPPNILVIVADDLGPGNVTCYDAQAKAPTPNIDRLASIFLPACAR